jgi:ammonia channel protein AmtB
MDERTFQMKIDPTNVERQIESDMGVYNVNAYGLGVMTLWFGWLFFNAGSNLSVED